MASRNESDAVVAGDLLRLFLLGWDVPASNFQFLSGVHS
jgi:hypothetical protein